MYTGELVRLRALEESDLNDLWRYLNDADTMRLVTDAPLLPATAEDVANLLREQTSHSTGVYRFAVETLAERRFIGHCGFVSLDRKNRHRGDRTAPRRFCGDRRDGGRPQCAEQTFHKAADSGSDSLHRV